MHNPSKPGPKPFSPTKSQREKVTLFKAGGLSDDAIAAQLGICRNTLLKHFTKELDEACDRETSLNLERLRKAAAKGNVTAMKYLDQKFGMVGAKDAFLGESRPPKLGKKEQLREQAASAGEASEWEGDLTPPPDALPN